MVPLAEGVERIGEHDFCVQSGFELGQGYFYGRPAAATASPAPRSKSTMII